MNEEPMKRHNYFLPDTLVEAMRQHGLKHGMTVSEIVRRAIQHYLATQAVKDQD